tara:strand:- start:1172 stop:1363 length:192 start_codon:yes stop_codon:yes gene_type:complete
MKRFIKNIINFIKNKTKQDTVMLGRWNLNNCDNKKTVINSIYQNRDHCGDIICKEPVKAEKYY